MINHMLIGHKSLISKNANKYRQIRVVNVSSCLVQYEGGLCDKRRFSIVVDANFD